MSNPIRDIEATTGRPFLVHQREALEHVLASASQDTPVRLCLYHRTGAGKTYTALAAMALAGVQRLLVLCPPTTHKHWVAEGARLGVAVTPISHAKFRQTGFKVSRTQAMVVDEFHLLGGHNGQGWKKLDRLAAGLRAPLIIASATPNYNDAERVYCIKHVLDPESCRGGYLQFLYNECVTQNNPFGMTPLVEGFKNYGSAEDYLKHMPNVHYVEDEAIKQVTVADVQMDAWEDDEFENIGLDRRRKRVFASQMEKAHARVRLDLIDDDGRIRVDVYERIAELVGQVSTPSLIFASHAEVAYAIWRTAFDKGVKALVVTGSLTHAEKDERIQMFKTGKYDILVGTATLATGTDGIDKMCDHLLILDDTTDDALRRQLIGRILPRGTDTDVSNKVVTRLIFT